MDALTEGLENYLEAILHEERERRFVRTKRLAERVGVTSPSVNAAVKELAQRGFVRHESYGDIELTPRGRRAAALVYSRHSVLYQFFARTLGLPSEISEANACGIEHHLDAVSLKKLTRFLDFLEKRAGKKKAFAAELREALGDD